MPDTGIAEIFDYVLECGAVAFEGIVFEGWEMLVFPSFGDNAEGAAVFLRFGEVEELAFDVIFGGAFGLCVGIKPFAFAVDDNCFYPSAVRALFHFCGSFRIRLILPL